MHTLPEQLHWTVVSRVLPPCLCLVTSAVRNGVVNLTVKQGRVPRQSKSEGPKRDLGGCDKLLRGKFQNGNFGRRCYRLIGVIWPLPTPLASCGWPRLPLDEAHCRIRPSVGDAKEGP